MAKNLTAAVIGDDVDALRAALYLAQIGADVKFVTDVAAFAFSAQGGTDPRLYWSSVLNAIRHPSIEFFYNSSAVNYSRQDKGFRLTTQQKPGYVNPDLCTGCKRCEENCSTRLVTLEGKKKVTRRAVHKPLPGEKSVPSAMIIEKNQTAPCRAACPLGINVQGFVSLLANNKIQEAFDLIDSSAPMGGILGRLCKHPCEEKCSRAKVDSPLSIRALHRFTYDSVQPAEKAADSPGAMTGAKVAIVGSGPAGLMAAWQLKRMGYEPTIFESHSTFGGMLATGIPRFRLPREIRQREIQKVLDMGIKVRTGITVGRDINFAYLKERDFKAFFLAIGASRNNRLGIPGEDLDGVIDCMSFLITLNQLEEAFVGSNIVIIGDGNSAVDSARVAIRKNKGSVKIVSWTVPEELTASRDEIEEALQEGISIEYSAYPVEIMGSDHKVTGVRCRRTRLTGDIMRNGWHRPEPVPDTDFIVEADHVIVAIGQSADASQLNLEGLDIDKASGTINVNPLTLETSVTGVFAGGDCMRGPNNVVDAMADGVRAAESIDRYLRGLSLEEGRQAAPKIVAEVDLKFVVPSPAARAEMPYLDMDKRKDTYEETTLGLTLEQAVDESGRCLSCALCSECMECVKICKAGAVAHDNQPATRQMNVDVIWKFPAANLYTDSPGGKSKAATDGVFDFTAAGPEGEGDIKLMNAIIQTALDQGADLFPAMPVQQEAINAPAKGVGPDSKCSVFLCKCNDTNSSVIDFQGMKEALSSCGPVESVTEVDQACSKEGAEFIVDHIKREGAGRAIIAACRCCNFNEVCYSCNDRRILCKRYIGLSLPAADAPDISYVNIRELCAWAHNDDHAAATDKAIAMLKAAIKTSPATGKENARYAVYPAAVFIGTSEADSLAAMTLHTLEYQVCCIENSAKIKAGAQGPEPGISYRDWPESIDIAGGPADYQVKIRSSGKSETLRCGAIILSSSLTADEISSLGSTYLGRLINRLRSRTVEAGDKYDQALNRAGIFINRARARFKADVKGSGIALAGRVLLHLRSKWVTIPGLTASVNGGLCRGCRTCAEQCLLIEIQENEKGLPSSKVEAFLCSGCGGCASVCPTGAISLDGQGANFMDAALRSCAGTAEK